MDATLEKAKTVISEEISRVGYRVNSVLLFGSRAKGEFQSDSDWDFLIVVDRVMDRETRWGAILAIKRRLAVLKIPNDIIVCSEEAVEEHKDDTGRITYYALKEGKPL